MQKVKFLFMCISGQLLEKHLGSRVRTPVDIDSSMEQNTAFDSYNNEIFNPDDVMCTHHPNSDRVTCNICGVNIHRGSWGRHKQTHTGQINFRCDICNKGFKRKFVLFNHRRLHTGEKPYVCGSCPKAFYTRSSLHNHVKTHGHQFYADK